MTVKIFTSTTKNLPLIILIITYLDQMSDKCMDDSQTVHVYVTGCRSSIIFKSKIFVYGLVNFLGFRVERCRLTQ